MSFRVWAVSPAAFVEADDAAAAVRVAILSGDTSWLANRMCPGTVLTADEAAYLKKILIEHAPRRPLPPLWRKRFEVAWEYIQLRAAGEKHDAAVQKIKDDHHLSVRTVGNYLKTAKQYEGGAWWREAERLAGIDKVAVPQLTANDVA